MKTQPVGFKRFVSQKCVRYDPQTDKSEWRMAAEFADGVYLAIEWLRDGEQFVAELASWAKLEGKQ